MTATKLRVLLIEPSDTDARGTLDTLAAAGYVVEHRRVCDIASVSAPMLDEGFDVVLCSDAPDTRYCLAVLKVMQQNDIDTPFLLLSHELDSQVVIRAMREGAHDYLLKHELNRLVPAIEHNLREARIRADHRKAQSELIENQARLHAFISDLPGMAYQLQLGNDGSVAFTYVSEGCQALLGIAPQELRSDAGQFAAFLHSDDRAGYQNSMLESAQNLSFWNWEGRVLAPPAQEIKWINLRCSPRQRSDGVQWEGIMLNITQSKQAEAKLHHSQERLRELSSHIHDVREQERIAIAREVHDDLGSLLTATKLEIAWLAGRLEEQPELAKKAKAIEALIDRCTHSASTISRSLRPSELDTFGLTVAIESEAQGFSQRTGIACTFDNSNDGVVVPRPSPSPSSASSRKHSTTSPNMPGPVWWRSLSSKNQAVLD